MQRHGEGVRRHAPHLTASFSVHSTTWPAGNVGRRLGEVEVVGQGEGLRQRHSARAQHGEEGFGTGDGGQRGDGLPARASSGTRAPSRATASAASCRVARWPCANAGCSPLCNTRSQCRGHGSRKGPAGSIQPLPTPRSSKTHTSTSRPRARCCRPSSHTTTSVAGCAASSARAACARRRATTTGTPVLRWISAGSSPTSRRIAVRQHLAAVVGVAAIAARHHADMPAARTEVPRHGHDHGRLARAPGDHVADDDDRHRDAIRAQPADR